MFAACADSATPTGAPVTPEVLAEFESLVGELASLGVKTTEESAISAGQRSVLRAATLLESAPEHLLSMPSGGVVFLWSADGERSPRSVSVISAVSADGDELLRMMSEQFPDYQPYSTNTGEVFRTGVTGTADIPAFVCTAGEYVIAVSDSELLFSIEEVADAELAGSLCS